MTALHSGSCMERLLGSTFVLSGVNSSISLGVCVLMGFARHRLYGYIYYSSYVGCNWKV